MISAIESSQNYSGFSNLPAKFISGRSSAFQGSSVNQPVRARSTLEKQHVIGTQKPKNNPQNNGLYSAASSSSVTTIPTTTQ